MYSEIAGAPGFHTAGGYPAASRLPAEYPPVAFPYSYFTFSSNITDHIRLPTEHSPHLRHAPLPSSLSSQRSPGSISSADRRS